MSEREVALFLSDVGTAVVRAAALPARDKQRALLQCAIALESAQRELLEAADEITVTGELA